VRPRDDAATPAAAGGRGAPRGAAGGRGAPRGAAGDRRAAPAAETGVDRIAAAFAAAPGRAALMPYLMGGYPDLESSVAIGAAYAEAGADLVELGVPFSDPLADGPVIHAAATKALQAGASVPAVLDAGARIAERVPVVLMCYANPLFARGPERFADELASRGISGLIVPDLPLEESAAVLAACDRAGIALVPLVAPTTPAPRLAAIGASARGFVYTVSVVGTTGERASVAPEIVDLLARAKAHSGVPVALGFGISTGAQAAAAAAAGADGVIVGSRLVRAVGEAADAGADPAAAAHEAVAELAAALIR
jgi:tryptophan synthase alpha chain